MKYSKRFKGSLSFKDYNRRDNVKPASGCSGTGSSSFFSNFVATICFAHHLFVYGFSLVCVKQIRLCMFIFIVYIVRFLSFFLCEGERKVLNVYVFCSLC